MTDCKTHYITTVVNEMKKHQVKMLNDYLETGMFTEESTLFWQDPYLLEEESNEQLNEDWYGKNRINVFSQ